MRVTAFTSTGSAYIYALPQASAIADEAGPIEPGGPVPARPSDSPAAPASDETAMPQVLEQHGKFARVRIPVTSALKGAWTIHVPRADRPAAARRSNKPGRPS